MPSNSTFSAQSERNFSSVYKQHRTQTSVLSIFHSIGVRHSKLGNVTDISQASVKVIDEHYFAQK